MVRHVHSRGGRLVPATAVALAVAAFAPPAPAPAQRMPGHVAQQVRDCANSERAKRGLPPLARNRVLDAAAAMHARNMARHDFFDHEDPWGRGPDDRIDIVGSWEAFGGIGENIAAGESSVAEACADWMASPGHRGAILDPKFHSIGGAFAMGRTGYRTYFVQEFGETNPGGSSADERPADRARPQPVAVRLFNARDRLTLSLDGQFLVTTRPGQNRTVELGRLGPSSRITVEAHSVNGRLSWGIEQRRGGRTVYRDARSRVDRSAEATAGVATSLNPLVHRVTLDPRGRVLDSLSRNPPRLGGVARWASVGPVARSR